MIAAIHVDNAETLAALRMARRQIDRGIREGLKAGAEKHGLPRAKILAPEENIVAALTAGATIRTAYIQMDLRIAPEGGLLEFGGTVRTVIRPVNAKALSLPAGPRAIVRNPRHYRGKHFMQRAVDQTLDAVIEESQQALARVFGQYVNVD